MDRLSVRLLAGVTLAFGLWTVGENAAVAKEIRVDSPNREVAVSVNDAPKGQLTVSVRFRGRTALAPSDLGVVVDGKNLGQNVTLGRPATHVVREKYATRGVHRVALNHYREAILPVTVGSVPWTLELRVFDDGVAYRYRVPGSGDRRIDGEASAWNLPPGSTIWYQSNRNKDYEAPYQRGQIEQLATGTTLAAPATVKLPNGLGYAMMTEANLVRYSDMALEVTAPGRFRALFHNSPQGWTNTGEIVSPWRVTVLAPDLNALVNTDIVHNLCPPPAPELANARWIQPGRTSWHWMVTGPPKLEQQRQWVDWTKQLGFEYYLIDDGWKRWRDGSKDAWSCLRDVVSYAATQNVRIFAWVNSNELLDAPTRAAYFQRSREAGLVGLKIDFPRPADAEWVQWYDDTLRDTARYRLMVDFHGAVKPTGRERTWPHELTREAIRGRENGKQSALHDATLPFVRYVQGHGDFTPTDLRPDRLTRSTRAHEVAQAIVYTSPLLCYSGRPEDYLGDPAADVIKAIPATWDETIVLPGSEIGEVAAYARRTGDTWFIGVLGDSAARTLPIALDFLGKGDYRVEQFADSPDGNDAWSQSQAAVTRKSVLSATMRPNGGFVARITKVDSR